MITLAIPYYSHRPYLARCVESVIKQTSGDWQIVIVDDCGPEGDLSGWISSQWPHLAPRLRYIRNPQNLGMAGNWSRCLDLAETDWVTILHSDDELLPNYVEAFDAGIAQFPTAAALYCQTTIIGPDNRPRFSFPDWYKTAIQPKTDKPVVLRGEDAVHRLLQGNFVMCPTLCYRKSALGARRFNPRWKMVLDFEFTTQLLREGETLVGLPVRAYAYRRHEANATARYTEDLSRFREEVALFDQLRDLLAAQGWHQAAKTARRKRIIQLNLLFNIVKDLAQGRVAPAKRKVGYTLKLLKQ